MFWLNYYSILDDYFVTDTCEDDNQDCDSWKRSGACDSNPSYALRHCKKSCNNCKDGEYLSACYIRRLHAFRLICSKQFISQLLVRYSFVSDL